MSGFGAAAPLSGPSATAGTRNGSGDSLEKIDMSLGGESALGPPLGERVEGRGLNQAPGPGGGTRNEPTGFAGRNQRGAWGGGLRQVWRGKGRAGPYHSSLAAGGRAAAAGPVGPC